MSEKNLPKNNPEEIGKVKNIISMSETSGKRGDVNSKIGIGLDLSLPARKEEDTRRRMRCSRVCLLISARQCSLSVF